ncbi:MAG: hypothetical protein GXY09_03175 [Bacteroidales bacterium]|nr:hypothetical protein [Bacteroidales bacterium]
MNRLLVTAFCPEPGIWLRMHVLTLDNDGQLTACVPYEGETAGTKVCAGLVFLKPTDSPANMTPTQALTWLKEVCGWHPGVSSTENLTVSLPSVASLWCLEGVDPQTGELTTDASVHALHP